VRLDPAGSSSFTCVCTPFSVIWRCKMVVRIGGNLTNVEQTIDGLGDS
jgi:hypothetical protein